jgi:two-component system chemotaxis response regulator CheB
MKNRIIVIGASMNGVAALLELVKDLPKDLAAPVLITQHTAPHSPGVLPLILGRAGPLPAAYPKDREQLKRGRIYVAPPDCHLLVERDHVRLSHGPKENLTRPAVDPLFRSAAVSYGPGVVGVVLTGQLDDGTAGLLAIKDRGGVAIVQDPDEAAAPSMPLNALKHVEVDHCCKLKDMPALLASLAADSPGSDPVDTSRMLEIEHHIAAGVANTEDWLELEHRSSPAGFSCPECKSSLHRLAEMRILRFRCRSGHAFSGDSLLRGLADAREALLSSMFSALSEEASLAETLTRRAEYSDDPAVLAALKERVTRLRAQAEQVSAWLHSTLELLEPKLAASSDDT